MSVLAAFQPVGAGIVEAAPAPSIESTGSAAGQSATGDVGAGTASTDSAGTGDFRAAWQSQMDALTANDGTSAQAETGTTQSGKVSPGASAGDSGTASEAATATAAKAQTSTAGVKLASKSDADTDAQKDRVTGSADERSTKSHKASSSKESSEQASKAVAQQIQNPLLTAPAQIAAALPSSQKTNAAVETAASAIPDALSLGAASASARLAKTFPATVAAQASGGEDSSHAATGGVENGNGQQITPSGNTPGELNALASDDGTTLHTSSTGAAQSADVLSGSSAVLPADASSGRDSAAVQPVASARHSSVSRASGLGEGQYQQAGAAASDSGSTALGLSAAPVTTTGDRTPSVVAQSAAGIDATLPAAAHVTRQQESGSAVKDSAAQTKDVPDGAGPASAGTAKMGRSSDAALEHGAVTAGRKAGDHAAGTPLHGQSQAAETATDFSASMRTPAAAGATSGTTGADYGRSVGVAPGPTARETFAALDADAGTVAASTIHTGPRHAEAGYQDPTLGWVEVRAEAGASGVHATLTSSSSEAAQVLGGHLAGLNNYLAEHRTPVESLTLESFGQQAGSAAGQGTGQGTTGQGDQQSSSQAQSNAPAWNTAAASGSEGGPGVSVWSGGSAWEGSHISVMA